MSKPHDARSLPPVAQEDLRRRVAAAVLGGMSKAEAARVFGVSRTAIHTWLSRVGAQGLRGLKARPRGRPRRPRLKPTQAATTVRILTAGCPDQLRLPYALWTREAVQDLLARKFRIRVSVWTVGRYLRAWGFTPQKPLRRAYEQDPEAVRRWVREEYPKIRARAKAEGAEIHWGDEMGVRSDHQAGRSWGRRGQTPVVPGTGQRFGCNMISSITNRGRVAFMVFEGRFTARVFLTFLRRLQRHRRRKIFLIVDRHPVHRAAPVDRWFRTRQGKIHLFFLPSYSPHLNPDELLNQDVKTNAVGRRRPEDKAELMANVRSYLRSTQKMPHVVKAYFREEHVRYAG